MIQMKIIWQYLRVILFIFLTRIETSTSKLYSKMKTNYIHLAIFQVLVEIILTSTIYKVYAYIMFKETPFKKINAIGVNTCF